MNRSTSGELCRVSLSLRRALRALGACALVLATAAPRAHGEDGAQPAQPAGPWTLERAGDTALESSPQVRAAAAAVEASRAYRAFGSMPKLGNPIVGLRAMIGRPDNPAATYAAYLGLPFDVSGRRRAWQREASWIEREAEARLAVIQNEARAEAREAFVDVVLGLEQERVAVANAETARDFLARVKARFDAKAATALDVALSQRDYAESVASSARARALLVEARGRLRQVLDIAPEATLETAGLPALTLPVGLTLEGAIALALERRRDPTVFGAGVERAQLSDVRLGREAVAPLVIAGEFEAQGNHQTQASGGVGLSAELPFLQRNQGERAAARAQGDLLRLEAELSRRRVGREAMIAFQQLEAALAELAAIEQQATPAAEQALQMTMSMLEAGAIDYFRLLNARESAFALRARRVEVLRTAWRQRIALERSIGGLSEEP